MFYCLNNKYRKMLFMYRKRGANMQDTKIDPRITRTRRLLMDAFLKLTSKKDFKDITIKDITDEATVNRATFYSHFQDKYDLMDASITEHIIENIVEDLSHFDQLNEKSIVKIFVTLTKFHPIYPHNYTDHVEGVMRLLVQ